MMRRVFPYLVVSIIACAGSMAQAGSPDASAAPVKATASDAGTPAGVLVAANTNESRRHVARAQRLLTRLGYRPGSADGVAGPSTRKAVRRFQAQHGLPVDGRVTSRLIAELERADVRARRDRSPEMVKLKSWIERNTARAEDFYEKAAKSHARLSARCAASRAEWIRNAEGEWIDCSQFN